MPGYFSLGGSGVAARVARNIAAVEPPAAARAGNVSEAFACVAVQARARKLDFQAPVDLHALTRALNVLGCAADYVRIEPGTFIMGTQPTGADHITNEALQKVTITTPFLLKQTPVTQREWRALMGNTPACFRSQPDAPVECVNFYDALAYCNALSRAEGLQECYALQGCRGTPGTALFSVQGVVFQPTANGYRLPTEREWEYAARAGSTGFAYGPQAEVAWYAENAEHTTHPVREKRPNAWRLYDMLGNVAEWLWDRYLPGRVDDPWGPSTGETRVIRGGCWADKDDRVRAAYRGANYPVTRSYAIGFRPARSLVG